MVKNIAKALTGGTKVKKVKVETPPIEEPTPLPDEDALKKAAMKAELMRRNTGRSSTLLADEDENLG